MKFALFFTISILALMLAANESKADAAKDLWAEAVTVPLKNSEAKEVGTAKLRQTPQGVLIHLQLSHLPAGTHAFHIHEAGKCELPDFTSAGGHFNPSGKKHGILVEAGKHAGDLPNIYVPESGALTIEVLAPQVNMKEGDTQLFDKDGAAFVIHSGMDDYSTDPAGAAGGRIACGVIAEPAQQ